MFILSLMGLILWAVAAFFVYVGLTGGNDLHVIGGGIVFGLGVVTFGLAAIVGPLDEIAARMRRGRGAGRVRPEDDADRLAREQI